MQEVNISIIFGTTNIFERFKRVTILLPRCLLETF